MCSEVLSFVVEFHHMDVIAGRSSSLQDRRGELCDDIACMTSSESGGWVGDVCQTEDWDMSGC
jgi:hypothetical protein